MPEIFPSSGGILFSGKISARDGEGISRRKMGTLISLMLPHRADRGNFTAIVLYYLSFVICYLLPAICYFFGAAQEIGDKKEI